MNVCRMLVVWKLVANFKRFHRGEWKGLETAMRFARREADSTSKRAHNFSVRDTSIQDRVAYAEHYARGAHFLKQIKL